MGEAIWSADPAQFERFPARHFAQFFKNHGFLNVRDQPHWLTIRGGSRRYVEPITRPFKHNVRLNCAVTAVRASRRPGRDRRRGRGPRTVRLGGCRHSQRPGVGAPGRSFAMPSAASSAPSAIRKTTRCCTPTPPFCPRNQAAWASWNYHVPRTDLGRVAVTYDMNLLQSIQTPVEFFVSLNLDGGWTPPRSSAGSCTTTRSYRPESRSARRRHAEINGVNRTYYCRRLLGLRLPRGRGQHRAGGLSALRAGADVKSALYEGTIRHRRFSPVKNEFRYRLFLRLPGPRRARPASSRAAGSGRTVGPTLPGSAAPTTSATRGCRWNARCASWSRRARAGGRRGRSGCSRHLRYFGHCFNPVSFYYCFDRGGPAGGDDRGRGHTTPPGGSALLCAAGARNEHPAPDWRRLSRSTRPSTSRRSSAWTSATTGASASRASALNVHMDRPAGRTPDLRCEPGAAAPRDHPPRAGPGARALPADDRQGRGHDLLAGRCG